MYSRRMSYFIAIAEIQNISKAAQVLHVSQPSLSQYLNRLEGELGVKLLDRTCTPIRLTEAGKLYLSYAREVTEAEKVFESRLETYKKRRELALALGIPTQLTPMLFRTIIQGFLHTHPETRLTIRDGTSLTVKEQLLKGEVDIAFFHTQAPWDSRFISLIFREEPLFLACNRRSSLAAGRAGTREEPLLLSEADFPQMEEMLFLIPPKDYFIHSVMQNYLREVGLQPKKVLEISVLSSICDYLLEPESNGISLLADFSVANRKNIDEITFLKIQGCDLKWYLTMSYMADTPLSESGYALWREVAGGDRDGGLPPAPPRGSPVGEGRGFAPKRSPVLPRLSPLVYRLPSPVCRLPSTVSRLPSPVCRLPSTVSRPSPPATQRSTRKGYAASVRRQSRMAAQRLRAEGEETPRPAKGPRHQAGTRAKRGVSELVGIRAKQGVPPSSSPANPAERIAGESEEIPCRAKKRRGFGLNREFLSVCHPRP